MNNLFSVFEPLSWMNLPLNWVASLTVMMLIVPPFWVTTSTFNNFLMTMLKSVYREFSSILNSNSVPGFVLMPLALFLFILMNNFFGLSPYVFTSSSHLVFTIGMALPLWIGHLVMAWGKTPTLMLAHLVPLGTPPPLMPFMVLIEMVSSMIRPITLSVRLAANMIAGHLLISLLGNSANFSSPSLSLVLIALVTLSVLETAVSMIQSYVFSVLSTLYVNEVNSVKMD